jgi:hypothetical protein
MDAIQKNRHELIRGLFLLCPREASAVPHDWIMRGAACSSVEDARALRGLDLFVGGDGARRLHSRRIMYKRGSSRSSPKRASC